MKNQPILLAACSMVISTIAVGTAFARDWPPIRPPKRIPNPITPIQKGVDDLAKQAQRARDDAAREADRLRREAEARAAQAAEDAVRRAQQERDNLARQAQEARRQAEARAAQAEEIARRETARQAEEARRRADQAARDFDRWRVERLNVPLNMAAEGTYWAMRDWVFERNQGRRAITLQRGTYFHRVLQHFFGAELPIEQIVIVFDAEVPNEMAAITFGDRIFVSESFQPNDPNQAVLLGHEFTHVLQVRRMGGEKQFGRRYVRQSTGAIADQLFSRGELNVNSTHDAIDLEKEANNVEERVRQFVEQDLSNSSNQIINQPPSQRPIPGNANRPNGNFSAILGIAWETVRYQDGTIGARVTGAPRIGSAGARIGLETGDVIFEIDGQRLRTGQELEQARPNSILRLINVRNSQQTAVRFPESNDGVPTPNQGFPRPLQTPANNLPGPQRPNAGRNTFFAANLGIEYERTPFDNGTFGARLTAPPAAGTPAAELQLEVGDVVFELDGQRFTTEQDVLNHFAQTNVRIINVRDKQIYAYTVDIPR